MRARDNGALVELFLARGRGRAVNAHPARSSLGAGARAR
jgi:hypothetical protein